MPLALTHTHFSGAVHLLAASAAFGLAAGCAGSSSGTRSIADDAAARTGHHAAYPVPVVRYGRYTLVEARPEAAQQHLLDQIVDISLPRAVETTVGDALHIVLQRTGYRRCEADSAAHALYALPLPAVHLQLGPMSLQDALRALAGPAWTLDVDYIARRVCFVQKDALDPAAEHLASGTGVNSTEQSKRAMSNDDRDCVPRRRRK